jgi:DNA repair protein RadB
MEDNKLATGSKVLDEMLKGGYEKDIITTIYGPAGAGKTVLCILCAINVARSGKKVVYVDSEGGFSLERLKQIASHISQDTG